jgi:xylulokinase
MNGQAVGSEEGTHIYAIGCDVGSQSLKGVLIAPDGSLVGGASARYEVRTPHDVWAEQDPEDWSRALESVVGRLRADAGLAAADIGSIGFASQVDGVVAVDATGRALRPAIIWMDRRASAQAQALRDRIGDAYARAITGLNVDAYHAAPKIRWVIEHEPTVDAEAAAYLLPGSYLVERLTGERVVDHANASSTLLYDVTSRSWSRRMLDLADIAEERLARIAAATEVAGTVTPEAASRLGVSEGCRVVVGTGDEHGAALGAGVIRPGTVCDITGTAEPIGVAALSPLIDETGLVETHAHADERAWFLENPGFVSGGSVRWFLDVFGGDEDRIDREASAVSPGSDGVTFVPALAGSTTPRWTEDARGSFTGLSLGHGWGHLARAVLEGCTFGLRDIVERLDEMGLASDEIRVVGGGARSETWRRMKADATGRVVRVLAHDEATALGAGYLAATAIGTFADLDEAIGRLSVLDPISCEPDPATRAAYDDAYGRYRDVFDALEPLHLGRGEGS